MALHAWILTAVLLWETMYLKVQQLITVRQILAGTSYCQCESVIFTHDDFQSVLFLLIIL